MTGETSDVGRLVAAMAHRYLGVKSAHHSSFHTNEYYQEAGIVKQAHLPHSAETGIDCSALVNLAVNDALREICLERAIPRHVKEFFRWSTATGQELVAGSLLFVHANRKRTPPSHMGIYLGGEQVIHSPGTATGCVERISLDKFIEGCIPMEGYGLFVAKNLNVR